MSQPQAADPVQRWSVRDLIAIVPRSTRKVWLVDWIPQLVAAGALHKAGKRWLGRRSAIEAALLAPRPKAGRRRSA